MNGGGNLGHGNEVSPNATSRIPIRSGDVAGWRTQRSTFSDRSTRLKEWQKASKYERQETHFRQWECTRLSPVDAATSGCGARQAGSARALECAIGRRDATSGELGRASRVGVAHRSELLALLVARVSHHANRWNLFSCGHARDKQKDCEDAHEQNGESGTMLKCARDGIQPVEAHRARPVEHESAGCGVQHCAPFRCTRRANDGRRNWLRMPGRTLTEGCRWTCARDLVSSVKSGSGLPPQRARDHARLHRWRTGAARSDRRPDRRCRRTWRAPGAAWWSSAQGQRLGSARRESRPLRQRRWPGPSSGRSHC